jgi:hypothetical protein
MGNHARSKAALAVGAATGALADAAQATLANEGDFGGDFGDDFSSETPLPTGTDVVNGNVSGGGDFADFISFQGLLPESSFSITATHDGSPNFLFLTERNDAGDFLQSGGDEDAVAFSGTIPASGKLHFDIAAEGDGSNYTIELTAPEPAASVLLGGGALAVAALHRLRARKGTR